MTKKQLDLKQIRKFANIEIEMHINNNNSIKY
jgi:hypothetical protein